MKCSTGESINHFVQNCPDKQGQDIFFQGVIPPQFLLESKNLFFARNCVVPI